MSIQFDDGKVTISTAYSLKVPSEDVAFASQDTHVSMSVEGRITSDDLAVVFKDAQAIRADLDAQVKLAVFASLGLGFKESDIGVLAPDLGNFRAAEKPAAKSYGGGGKTFGKPSGGGGSFTSRNGGPGGDPAKYDNLPKYQVTVAGKSVTIQDQRSLKASGSISAKAPDFKVDEPRGQGFWLTQQDGSTNSELAEWLSSEGVSL